MRNVILASLAVVGLAVLPAAAPASVSKRKCDPNYRGGV
jgi:hypothetical protein